jgi:hypothetical protein
MALQELKFYKVNTVPVNPEPSSVYFVKNDVNSELTIYMTDANGTVYYKTNNSTDVLTAVTNLINSHPYLMMRNPNPIYTYGSGANSKNAIRIDYSNGVYKTFEYFPNNTVKKISTFGTYFTIVKDFLYNTNGTLNRVNETVS